MCPNRVSNPGPLTYESGALPTALRGPACGNDSERLLGVIWSTILLVNTIIQCAVTLVRIHATSFEPRHTSVMEYLVLTLVFLVFAGPYVVYTSVIPFTFRSRSET